MACGPWLATKSPLVERARPPSNPWASCTVTSAPASAPAMLATKPAIPPPMTVILRLLIFASSLLNVRRTRGREPFKGSAPLETVEDLVRAAQRGDPRAMDALMRELSPRLGRICASISLQHAEDALQETLIAVLQNISSLREP